MSRHQKMQRPTPRRDAAAEYLYGTHAVREALLAGRRSVHRVWMAATRHADSVDIGRLCAQARVSVAECVMEKLYQMVRTEHHQGVVAEVAPYPYVTVESLLEQARQQPRDFFLVVLDQVQDPHNLGSIVRTALGCGAHGVVTLTDRAAGVTSAVAKASAGAVEWMPIAQVVNLAQLLRTLKSENIWVVGLAGEGATDLYAYEFRGAHAMVLGAEGTGLRRLVRELCDSVIRIPIGGAVGSYNVAVAGAMVLGEFLRQKGLNPLDTSARIS